MIFYRTILSQKPSVATFRTQILVIAETQSIEMCEKILGHRVINFLTICRVICYIVLSRPKTYGGISWQNSRSCVWLTELWDFKGEESIIREFIHIKPSDIYTTWALHQYGSVIYTVICESEPLRQAEILIIILLYVDRNVTSQVIRCIRCSQANTSRSRALSWGHAIDRES